MICFTNIIRMYSIADRMGSDPSRSPIADRNLGFLHNDGDLLHASGELQHFL